MLNCKGHSTNMEKHFTDTQKPHTNVLSALSDY